MLELSGDGSPTGWTDGYCIADCSSPPHTCDAGSGCYLIADDGTSICLATCSGDSDCRSGYVCFPEAPSACIPRCDAPGNSCLDGGVCNPVSGLCEEQPDECTPGTASCDGVVATWCNVDGEWEQEECDWGCIADPQRAYDLFHAEPGCAPYLNACSYQCSAPLATSCNCCVTPLGDEWVCEDDALPFQSPGRPRPCESDVECGTRGHCSVEQSGSYCRALDTQGECEALEFACLDGDCIPDFWQCDDVDDCAAGEDELGCDGGETSNFRANPRAR